MGFKLIVADYLVIVAFILFLCCHVATNYLIFHYKSVAEQVGIAENIAFAFEANPVARYMFGVEQFKVIYSYVLMPGLIAGVYYLQRRRYAKYPDSVTAFAIALVVVAFSNFLNDFSVLLGVLGSI